MSGPSHMAVTYYAYVRSLRTHVFHGFALLSRPSLDIPFTLLVDVASFLLSKNSAVASARRCALAALHMFQVSVDRRVRQPLQRLPARTPSALSCFGPFILGLYNA